jgi:hypothetical protein
MIKANASYEQNVDLLNVTAGGTDSNQWALAVNF